MKTEIELSGNKYSIGKLSAMRQFHVSRRIAPIIPTMIPIFLRMRRDGFSLSDDLDGLGEILQPFADGLAAMKDDDAEYVIGTCMAVVQRKNETGWATIWAEQQKVMMFQDIDMAIMLPLTVRVITANLGPFINGLLTSLPSSPESPAPPG